VNPTPSQSSDVKFEIGHVLFIDIVGYSKLLITEQSEQIQKLKEIVRGTEQVRLAQAEGKLLRLPTGDGGALVFRTSPEAPVLCAIEIAKALKSHPDLKVRMGIHSGPVNEVTDLNAQANIAGAGINIAQRVMDCGDAGHILLSKHVADDLEHYPRWQPHLHSLGECEVKHGIRIGVVNFHNNEVGNPKPPRKLQAVQQRRARTRWAAILTALLLLSAIVVAFVIVSKKSARSTSTIPNKSIAVLPFENLSEDKANAYFADGIQDEILTKLATIADLKVISRTSTAKYKSKPEDLRTVSQQLGAATVLEGSVQKAADKVRVNVQLIDARADAHLWAKTFDRELKDVFAVESEVSQEIADALQAKLSPNEADTLAATPTKDTEAYDLFLKGEYLQHAAESSLKGEDFDRATASYGQAIARDPNFALAMARRVESRSKRYHWGDAPSETEVEELRKEAEHAVALAPDLAEAHLAMGLFYYYASFQFDRAVAEFQHSRALQPNNVRALSYLAAIHLRQGQLERSLAELKKCEELDPRDPAIPDLIGGIYLDFRMWEEAKRAGLHSLALDPRNVAGMHVVFFSYLNGTGDIKEATRILQTFPPEIGAGAYIPGGFVAIIDLEPYLSVVQRDFAAAYKAWGDESSDPIRNRLRLAARAVIHVLAGDAATAQAEIEKARELVEAKLREQPEDADSMIQLSWINLALGRNAEALRLARQAIELVPVERDAVAGTFCLAAFAEIQARARQPVEAVQTLQRLLSMPAGLQTCIQRLKIDPVWDPIRNDPQFQRLLTMKEQVGPLAPKN
jgi:TolB-like protein/class 3 adenylate cyclase/Flp pilus assembly protein TadD